MPSIGKPVKESIKSSKERKNALTRSRNALSASCQSWKEHNLHHMIDNRYIHEFSEDQKIDLMSLEKCVLNIFTMTKKESGYEPVTSHCFGNNKCNTLDTGSQNTEKTEGDNKPATDLILQVMQTDSEDQTDVKVRWSDKYPKEEKCDPVKNICEKETEENLIATYMSSSNQSLEEKESFNGCEKETMDSMFDNDINCQEDKENFRESDRSHSVCPVQPFASCLCVIEGGMEEMEYAATEEDFDEDKDKKTASEKEQKSLESENLEVEDAVTDLSSVTKTPLSQTIEKMEKDITESVDEKEVELSVTKGLSEGEIESASFGPIGEICCFENDMMNQYIINENGFTHQEQLTSLPTFSSEEIISLCSIEYSGKEKVSVCTPLPTLQVCEIALEIMGPSLKEDTPFHSFSLSLQYQSYSWQDIDGTSLISFPFYGLNHFPSKSDELLDFPVSVNQMAERSKYYCQIGGSLMSSDMNISGDGLLYNYAHTHNDWFHQQEKGMEVNMQRPHDSFKQENLLKKMPQSMDNRKFTQEGEDRLLKMCMNSLSKRRRPLKTLKKHPVQGPSYPFCHKCVMKRSRNSSSKCQDGNEKFLACKRHVPRRHCFQIRSCQWRCRTYSNGNSRSSSQSGSNDGSDHTRRSGGRDSGGSRGNGHRQGNENGNNGNGDDREKDRRRKSQPMALNIFHGDEEDSSDSDNDHYVKNSGEGTNVFNQPRPPDNANIVGAITVCQSDMRPEYAQLNQGELDNKHSTISVEDLCYLLGHVAVRPLCNIFDGHGHALNVCFTQIMHQLQLASDDWDEGTDCQTCMILKGLFKHLANSENHGTRCNTCRQIVTLVIHHTEGCIKQIPPQTHRTNTDLCYKICQAAMWDSKMLRDDPDIIKTIVMYCSGILKSIQNTNIQVNEQDLSLPTAPQPDRGACGFANQRVNAAALPAFLATADVPADYVNQRHSAQEMRGAIAHMPLSRKPSNSSRPLDVPPSIQEESSSSSDDESDVMRDIPNDRSARQTYSGAHFNPQNNDPMIRTEALNYATSMPEGTVNDATQFHSLIDRPVGIRGIGEVTFGNPQRLCLVANYWQKKREECEQTNRQPSQLREEGVILEEFRGHFKILGTRYQEDSQWKKLTALGNGMHGKCFLAMDMKTGHQFCVKKVDLLHYECNELCLWADLNNPYIVKLYGAIRHGYIVYIFSEFIDGGDLAYVITQQKAVSQRLSHWTAIKYFQQLLKALAYLHSCNVLHEDVKAENILLRGNSPQIALTDFGMSRRLQGEVEMKNKWPIGTATHFSPEKAASMGHGFPADVWAAVCVLVYMMSSKLPWHHYLKGAGCLNYIIYIKPPPMENLPANIQDVVKDLIVQGFNKDPKNRPSASELLQHQAFQMLYGETPESFYSTLMTGLNSVCMSSVKGSEKRLSIAQSAQKNKDDAASVHSADSDTVLYSLSFVQGESGFVDEARQQEGEDLFDPTEHDDHTLTQENLSEFSQEASGSPIQYSQNDSSALDMERIYRENAMAPLQPSEEQAPAMATTPIPRVNELPRLEDLLSIPLMDYFQDVYDSDQKFDDGSKQNSKLEVFEPSCTARDLLPHLFIFDGSFDFESKLSGDGGREPLPDVSLRQSGSQANEDLPPEELSNLLVENPSSLDEPASDASPKAGGSVTLSSKDSQTQGRSDVTTYQKKKPLNLTLNVSGTIQRQTSQGRRDTASSTVSSSSDYQSLHTGSASGNDIHAQQEREFKDIMSSQSSENGTFSGMFGNIHESDAEQEDENGAVDDDETHRPTDEKPLVGKKVSLYNEANELLFHVRFLSTPVILYPHLSEIKKKIYMHNYKHFELEHMDSSKVSYSSELICEQLRVRAVIPPQYELCNCTCVGCQNI